MNIKAPMKPQMPVVRQLYLFVGKLYAFVFARPAMQFFNDALLKLALRGRGYDNFGDLQTTGEQAFIDLLAKFNPALCIDVGANTGYYSQTLLESTNTKVIAFEPQPVAFRALQDLAARFPERLVAINTGVGNENTQLELYYSEESSELASFSREINEIPHVGAVNKNTIEVPVVTLDSYFSDARRALGAREIDLLKIDTEGFEYEVLAGATTTIKQLRPKFIQLEYNWHQLFRTRSLYSFATLLEGYVPYQLLAHGSGMIEVDPRKPESNIYRYANFVFVREDIRI
jgi:FkbM family methyltransferase